MLYSMLYLDLHLLNPASKAMAVQIKRVTTSFGSAIVELTFSLQCIERSQMPPVSAWHKVEHIRSFCVQLVQQPCLYILCYIC